MGSPTEAQAHLGEIDVLHPGQRLFITPWLEVEALCRSSLLRFLEGRDAALARTAQTFFDLRQTGDQAGHAVDKDVWLALKATLERTRVVDPACGEAHMLLGALELLAGLLAEADRILGIETNPRDRRLSIVRHNLYGVEAQVLTLSRARRRLARAIAGPGRNCPLSDLSHLAWGDSLVEREEFRWREGFRPIMECGGFDLVLGNPPFVRHERIADPLNRLPAEDYKQRAFAAAGAKQRALLGPTACGATNALSHRSDLSVLFTVFGLSLVRPGGVLGFVLPNAVSSAQYGEPFWQTLASAGFDSHLVENRSRRSFTQAAVNTAQLLVWRGTENPVIAAREPADVIQVRSSRFGPVPRPRTDAGGFPAGLRRLQSRIAARCTPLASLGRLRYPIKTGLNCFFYPDLATRSRFNIESRFLVPVVKSPRDVDMLTLSRADLGTVLFHCSLSPPELRRDEANGALSYIAWGTEQTRAGSNAGTRMPWPAVPSVCGRNPWYSIPLPSPAHILCPRFLHRRFFFALPEPGIVEDQTFYGLTLTLGLQSSLLLVGALLNSSLSYLMMETHGRTGLGDGVRQYALRDMSTLPVLDPNAVNSSLVSSLAHVFEHVASRPILPIEEDVQRSDRVELDDLVCAATGLSRSDGATARQYLTGLVEQRLARARLS